ncbi:MAG: dihydrolipoyl dehydrogenase [Gammaproteobacteria bacterium]|nr:dihydrolipoyl dehydrogenase [Gammaproteobacteria bacterium]
MQNFDVVVIGGGPGGYVAAIRCAQLGLRTACIDPWINKQDEPALGGTCLNTGCIPSKALLDSSEHYHRVQHRLGVHGISVKECALDLGVMIKRKDDIVRGLTSGVAALFLKNKVTWIKGQARLLSNSQIEVTPQHAKHSAQQTVEAKHIIIATGSVPTPLSTLPVDQKYIVDSTGALDFTEIPKHLVVIGGGVIGLELGSVWRRLGSQVTVLIRGGQMLGKCDESIAAEAQRLLAQQGMDLKFNASPLSVSIKNKTAHLVYRDAQGEQTLKADKILVATGRTPNTAGLGAREVGVQLDDKGFIVVDAAWRTSLPNVYAIGDVIGGAMLAHKASEEGVAVAERIAGQAGHVNYATIPWVIYTWPEIAWVGETTQSLREKGIEFKIGSYPFKANGRARAMDEGNGMVKILADAHTDRVLGIHILGPYASEMIAEAVVAMEFVASSEDLARTIHAHPTLSEAMHEAALAVDKRAIHF